MTCGSFGSLQAGKKVSPNTIVPSVQILALHLHFRVSKEVKMLASFLRCFPGVETLCVQVKPVSPLQLFGISSSLLGQH
jgi:hypothetical protein